MKTTDKKKRKPLFHIVRRGSLTGKQQALFYLIAIVGGLFASSIVCSLFSAGNPFQYFASLFSGAFSTERRIWLLLQDTALLLGVSLALVPAFKMRFWNLGANGQILVGCLASVTCMHYLGGVLPGGVVILLMIVTSITAGAVWAVIPALFKAFFDTNESLFTLMMNYIAQGLVAACITVWVKTGSGVLTPIAYANLPEVINKYFLTIFIFFALTALMYAYLKYSKHGYEIAVVGESRNTAKYIGINVRHVIIRTLILSGAISGLVGLFIGGGIDHTVNVSSAGNMGFTAIMTAWLANFNPLLMVLTCFFITFISKGMTQVRKDFKFTNDAVANIVVGILYFCVIACSFFITYRIVFRKKEDADEVSVEDEISAPTENQAEEPAQNENKQEGEL